MKTIILEGALGKEFGTSHEFEVDTAREAYQALCQYPGFKGLFSMSAYLVRFSFGEKSIFLDEHTIDLRSDGSDTITFKPIAIGANDALRIAAGVFVFVVAPYLGFVAGAAFGSAAVGAAVAGFAVNLGAALVLSGVAGILTSTPNVNTPNPDTGATERDFLFSGPVNTATQGGVVPLAYGRVRAGSVVVSQGIISESLTVGALPSRAPAPTPSPAPAPPPTMDRSNGGGRGGHNNGRGGGGNDNNGGTGGRGDANASRGTA